MYTMQRILKASTTRDGADGSLQQLSSRCRCAAVLCWHQHLMSMLLAVVSLQQVGRHLSCLAGSGVGGAGRLQRPPLRHVFDDVVLQQLGRDP